MNDNLPIYDEDGNVIIDPDLENGYLSFSNQPKPGAEKVYNKDLDIYYWPDGSFEDCYIWRKKDEAYNQLEKDGKGRKLIPELPSYESNTDDTVIELYETTLSQSDILAQQDDAIIELYEMIIGSDS